jgi:hypothetical protein
MLCGIPAQAWRAQGSGILQAAKPLREVGAVLEGVARGFGIRVIMTHLGPARRLGHPQLGPPQCPRLGSHATAAVGRERSLARLNPLRVTRQLHQRRGQGRTLAMGDHPAHHGTTVDVEADTQVVIAPLARSLQLRDVP